MTESPGMVLGRFRHRFGSDKANLGIESNPDPLWALDIETTGLRVGRDRIIEIAMVPIRERAIRLGEAWTTLVKPDQYRTTGTPIHGIREFDLANGLGLDEALNQLWERCDDSGALLVHHRAIDLNFLRHAHQRLGRPWPDPYVIDTVDLLELRNRKLTRLGEQTIPLALGEARRHVGLPSMPQHRALDDALATAELWLAITGNPKIEA